MTNYRQKDTQVHRQRGIHAPQKKKDVELLPFVYNRFFFLKQQKEDFKKSKKILTFSISNVMYNSAHFIFFIS